MTDSSSISSRCETPRDRILTDIQTEQMQSIRIERGDAGVVPNKTVTGGSFEEFEGETLVLALRWGNLRFNGSPWHVSQSGSQ